MSWPTSKIPIEKKTIVQCGKTSPCLIFVDPLCTCEVKYCFLAEILKKVSEIHVHNFFT